jgi:Transposase DDE domain
VAVEPETGLITACVLTPANAGDGPTGVALLDGETPGLQVLADSAYGSGEVRVAIRRARHQGAIKAIPLRRAIPGGFDRDDFIIDHHARTATCPGGHTIPIAPKGGATFGPRCTGCAVRARCTTAKDGRTLHIGEHDAELVAARQAWRNGDFAADYRRWRPMVERSIAWLVAHGHRRVRYRGLTRNQAGLATRVAALNSADSSSSASTTTTDTGSSPHNGPGEAKEGPHPRAPALPGSPAHTLTHRLFGSAIPRTHNDPTTTSQHAPCSTAGIPPKCGGIPYEEW